MKGVLSLTQGDSSPQRPQVALDEACVVHAPVPGPTASAGDGRWDSGGSAQGSCGVPGLGLGAHRGCPGPESQGYGGEPWACHSATAAPSPSQSGGGGVGGEGTGGPPGGRVV